MSEMEIAVKAGVLRIIPDESAKLSGKTVYVTEYRGADTHRYLSEIVAFNEAEAKRIIRKRGLREKILGTRTFQEKQQKTISLSGTLWKWMKK